MRTNADTLQPALLGMVFLAAILLTTPMVQADRPPTGRTYFIASLGLATDRGEAYEIAAGCLRFTATELCDTAGECGEWRSETWGEPGPKQGRGSFSMSIVDDESGLIIEIDGTARIDARGPKSTIAGVARASEATTGLELNFGFVGRHVPRARCLRLVEDYQAQLALSR